jgi:RNA polymerase sigma-70 factor (ECF subfamily)
MQLRARAMDTTDVVAFLDAALPEVYGYLLSRTRDVSVAEDLASETLLAALQRVQSNAPEVMTNGWLIGIARHKLVDHWRREERLRRYLSLLPSEPDSISPIGELDPGTAHEVLAELNPAQRGALTLRYVDGLAVAEVASFIGRSVTATETLLARARVAFRRRYQEKVEIDE